MTAKGKILAKSVAKGTKKMSSVPESYVEDVKEWLIQFVENGEQGMTKAKYEEITGEPYPEPETDEEPVEETTEE